MSRLKGVIENFVHRQTDEDEDSSEGLDRMAREIRGSIWTLIALFALVSLTSYIPIDTFNFFHGRLDHMNNMGGIVGALLAEGFLGTVGIAGYAAIVLTLWLAFDAFRGTPVRKNFFRLLGTVLGMGLAAITCQLLWNDKFPETSLLQGGIIGKYVGTTLRNYFNTTGALLLVGGGFVVTLILTTGFSITETLGLIFNSGDEFDDDATSSPERPVVAKPTIPATPVAAPVTKEKKKPARRTRAKKVTDPDADDTENSEEESSDGESSIPQASAPTPGVFQDLIPFSGSFSLPSTRLLKNFSNAKKLSRGELKENSQKLIEHLLSFQITGQVTSVSQGPVLVTYEFKPSAGVKLSKIAGLQDDLGVVLGTRELRIVAPIPGKTVVGIEVPRPQIDTIGLKEIVGEKGFYDKKIKIPVALGKSTDGRPIFGDLTAMPHLLVAGATGSGKSVFVNSLIMSFLFRLTPRELRLILIDPKMLELNAFDGIPHLITNVITDNRVAFSALNWAVEEMERRYQLMAQTNSKNIDSYNEKQRSQEKKLPFIVIIVDELADLMMSGGEDVEVAITRLAQKARAAGIHLVLATQRPSTDVVTGLIKANIPSRISFKVPSGIDSRTILDTGGAENLIGRGDCLMIQPAVPIRRLHGTFVTEDELTRVVKSASGGKNHSRNYIQFSAAVPDSEA